jgi:hypothetical protein
MDVCRKRDIMRHSNFSATVGLYTQSEMEVAPANQKTNADSINCREWLLRPRGLLSLLHFSALN